MSDLWNSDSFIYAVKQLFPAEQFQRVKGTMIFASATEAVRHENLMVFFREHNTTWEIISALCLLETKTYPQSSHGLFECIYRAFQASSASAHFGFGAGTILGFMESLTWLDTQQDMGETQLDKMVINFLTDAILCRNGLMGRTWQAAESGDYRARLSQATKTYFSHNYRRGTFRPYVRNMVLQSVVRRFKEDDKREDGPALYPHLFDMSKQNTPVGKLLLEDLSYGGFSQLSPYGRASYLVEVFERQMRDEREQKRSLKKTKRR